MNTCRLIIISFFYGSCLINAGGTRNLIILLDWQTERIENSLNRMEKDEDKGFSAVTSTLITALMQKTAPILVSNATWNNFIKRRALFNDFLTLDEQQLIEKYKHKFLMFSTDQKIQDFKRQCLALMSGGTKDISKTIRYLFACYAVAFEQEHWTICKVSEHFILLIPQYYLENQRAKKDIPSKRTFVNESLTDLDLALGFKIDNKTSIENPLDTSLLHDDKQVSHRKEFLALLADLFITINDIKDPQSAEQTEENIVYFLHRWYLFSQGHGGPGSTPETGVINDLSVPEFSQFLQFLNNRINTDFLLYITCYAGGPHLVAPYQETWNYPPLYAKGPQRIAQRPLTFNFVIIANTLNYESTFAWTPLIKLPITPANLEQNIATYGNLSNFFIDIKKFFYSRTTSPQRQNQLLHALNYVYPVLKKERDTFVINPHHVPAIRFPGTQWFSLIDIPQEIFRLTKNLLTAHQAQDRKIVVHNKQVLIIDLAETIAKKRSSELFHEEIDVPIKMENTGTYAPSLPTIFSTAIGPAVYYFQKIVIPTHGLIALMNACMHVAVHYSRTYYINELIVKNDLNNEQSSLIGAVPFEQLNLHNVILVINDEHLLEKGEAPIYGVFFNFEGKTYYAMWRKNEADAFEGLKNKKLPFIKESNQTLPTYPFHSEKEFPWRTIVQTEKKKRAQKDMNRLLHTLQQLTTSLQRLSGTLM